MMKKILSLVLVVVLMALTLTGCAYRYDRKDMSKYATVDFAKFEAFLDAIEIEDGDFGHYVEGSYARAAKVLEKIDSILFDKIDAKDENKLGEGRGYGYRQKIFFAYYCSIEIDDVKHFFNTKKMDDASLTTLNSNPVYEAVEALTPTEELILKTEYLVEIFKAINGKSVTEFKYDSETSSSTALAAGDFVFATYTYTYSDGTDTKTVTTEYMPILVAAADGEVNGVGELLVGKSLGKIEIDTANPLKFKNEDGKECTLSSLTVNLRAKGECIEVKHTTYDADATVDKVTDAADTATNSKLDLKGKEITYYVFPAYAYEVAELSAETIVDVIYGENITENSLPVFKDDEDLTKIVEKIADQKADYDELKSKADATGATDAQKADAKEAREELDELLETLYEDLIKKDSAVAGTILEEYKEAIYEDLETAYDKDIRTKLASAIWKWAEENIKVSETLPKSAVKEAKEQILAAHKYTYYTGSDSDKKNYADTYQSFNEYLLNGIKDADNKTVVWDDKKIEAEAKADVAEIVRIYALAQHYDEIARVTNADVSLYLDELYPQLYYDFYLSGNYSPTVEDVRDLYGDTALRASLTFDRVMDHFLATTEDEDGHISYTKVKINYN